ncbi:hypothetical protein F4779DRAFT_625873 [Xylariaceae sp. FL0662B]|nr:hypothetical protein F4779DRAFT_625873 [Xylariaceae sp. FL0662B]
MDFLSHTFSEPENKVAEVNEYDRTVSPTPPSDSSSVVTGGYVDERKGQIIDSVVHAVTLWLRSRFIFAHQATSHTEEVPQSEGGQSTKSEQRQSSSHPDQSKKRKLADRGDGDGGGGEEDGNEDDRNPYHIDNTDSKGKRRELAKFACPYFKYNPAKYKEWRICPGPGWPDVHRVKEHLYRRHRQPAHRCGRCWQPFEDEQDYLNHQRTAEPCSLREKEPTEGFDASQEKKLKSRKKVANEMGEVAKWQAVFSILFPHVSKEDIPSPFYDYDQFGNIMGPSSQNYLTECEEYVLREVPPRLRQILRPELDRDLNIIEESLKIRAINCVKTLLTETFREFRQVHQQRMTPEVNNESTSLAGDAGPSSMQPPAAIGLEDYDLDHPEQDSFAGFDAGLDFFDMSALANLEASLAEGVLMEDILQPSIENTEQKQSDSGYESNIVERPSRDLSE